MISLQALAETSNLAIGTDAKEFYKKKMADVSQLW